MDIRLSRHRRGNPVAAAPILRKGGVHQKSKTVERTQIRNQLKREASEWRRPGGG
ncbi:MAG: hypothetical protein IT490_08875 [Candidatus Contendobacter sp.]|nr:hypothetical protein [Candidatus Contendobacter sp.]